MIFGSFSPPGFIPISIRGNILWIDATFDVTYDPSSSFAITAVKDRSPAGNNLTAASPTRPVWQTGIFYNSTKPSFFWNAVGNFLSASGKIVCPHGFSAHASVIFTTAGGSGDPRDAYLSIIGDAVGTQKNAFGIGLGTVQYVVGTTLVQGTGSYDDGNLHTISVSHDTNGNVNLYVDGALNKQQTITPYDGANTGFSVIGSAVNAGDGYVGYIAELMIWDAALQPDDFRMLNARSIALWGSSVPVVLPFDPTQVTSLIAWWHGDHVTLDISATFVVSWTPFAGTSSADSTYILANSDGTFATTPIYESPDADFPNPKAAMGTAGDEIRFLENTAFSSPISQPVTVFLVYFVFSSTNNTYFLLNTSGSTVNCSSMISEDPSSVFTAGDTTAIGTQASSINTPYVMGVVYDPTTNTSKIYQNSHTASVTGTTNGDTITSLFTGSFPDGEPSSWRMRHILMYAGVLSAANITAIMDYLGNEVGVTIS